MHAREGRHLDAVALYEWNAQISAAFLEILCHVEVLLRNAIDRQFPITDGEAPLSILDAGVWLCDPATVTAESRGKVNEAIARLQRERKRPTRDRVIASLSFGFWQSLFSGAYEELWRKRLWRAFPNGSGRRREIANLTGPILHFRNRVAHHEPIFFSNLERHHARVLELASLIDEEAALYIAALSRVEQLLREKP
ncbi:MAG TPA: Abi family protein [Solirubrobacterales bacterium]|nr:Abi family protein [Solirubrobacterales bacterium]